jgi:D-alanine-D-alanine ligase
MIKNSKHIEIVRSTTKGLSSMSRASSNAIFDVLSKHFTYVVVTIINNVADLEMLVARRPDLVFLGMEFVPVNLELGTADPHKVWLSDFLDNHGIAYTGSSQTAQELERNKPMAKQRALQANLKTSAYYVIEQDQSFNRSDIPVDYPLFIKPANRGGGLGIDCDSLVHTFEQLKSKVYSINTALASDALIEEYLPGREFSVAILKEEFSEKYLIMPIELVAPPDKYGSRFLSSQIKSANAEQALVVSEPSIKSKVITLALNVFNALGARDYGRIDIRLDSTGTPHFLEANLIPSLISGYGSFPKACVHNIGLEYESMILRIANLGLSRNIDDIETIAEPVKKKDAFIPREAAFERT